MLKQVDCGGVIYNEIAWDGMQQRLPEWMFDVAYCSKIRWTGKAYSKVDALRKLSKMLTQQEILS